MSIPKRRDMIGLRLVSDKNIYNYLNFQVRRVKEEDKDSVRTTIS